MKWSNLYFLNTCPKRKIIIANKHVYRGRNFSCSPLCEGASHSCPNLKTNNIPGKSNQNVRRRPISEPPLTCENLRCRPLPLKGRELHLVMSGAWTGFWPPTWLDTFRTFLSSKTALLSMNDNLAGAYWQSISYVLLLCWPLPVHSFTYSICSEQQLYLKQCTELTTILPFYIKTEVQRVCVTH